MSTMPATRSAGVCTAGIAGVGVFLLIAAMAAGQMPGRPRLYDPQTVETVSGEVVGTEQVKPSGPGKGGGRTGGLHVALKSGDRTVSVHVGPSWYLQQQGLHLAVGDRIEVRGSRVTFEGKPAIIAAEVTKGQQHVRLRDDSGIPAWRGKAGAPRTRTP